MSAEVPELRSLLPVASVAALEAGGGGGGGAGAAAASVRPVFEPLMKADRAAVTDSLNTFLQRLEKEGTYLHHLQLYQSLATAPQTRSTVTTIHLMTTESLNDLFLKRAIRKMSKNSIMYNTKNYYF